VNAEDYLASQDYIKEFETFNRSEISPTEFAALVSRFGFSWTDEELKRQFARVDADKSGFVDQAEFLEFCTSVLDNGGTRKVVIKFMKQKDQCEREKTSQTDLESHYVIRASVFLSSPEFATAVKSVEKHELADYPHGIVMPVGDRNLLSIFQSERPSTAEIPLLMKQVAEAVHHLHSKDLMHGDFKMINLMCLGNRLRLIDFDAAASLSNGSLAGAKFSSGVLPPEMFAKLTKDEKGKYNEYWKGVDEELQGKCCAKTTTRGPTLRGIWAPFPSSPWKPLRVSICGRSAACFSRCAGETSERESRASNVEEERTGEEQPGVQRNEHAQLAQSASFVHASSSSLLGAPPLFTRACG